MTSIQELFTLLAKHHLEQSENQPKLGQNLEEIRRNLQQLRKILYRALFNFLGGPLQDRASHRLTKGKTYTNIWDCYQTISFKLRLERQFDDADELDKTILELREGKSDAIEDVLQVLYSLNGSGGRQELPSIGHEDYRLPFYCSNQKKETSSVDLISGPFFHGDSKFHNAGRTGYDHYARELFEAKLSSTPSLNHSSKQVSGKEDFDFELLKELPGTGLHGCGSHFNKKLTMDQEERFARRSLFSSLSQSSVSKLDTRLTLPILPDTSNPDLLGLKIPNLSEPSEDEGFHESVCGSLPSSALTTPEKDNVWARALRYQPCKHKTWETIKQPGRKTARPYLTEAGSEVFDKLYRIRCRQAVTLDPSCRKEIITLPNQRLLSQHIAYVLLGLASNSFSLDQQNQCFSPNPRYCLTGTTLESFQPLLQEFAEAGSHYLRLTSMSQPHHLGSSYSGGLVVQAFLGSVRKFLRFYQAAIMTGTSGREVRWTALKIRNVYGKLILQLRYLSHLCLCGDRKGTRPGDPGDPLPLGIDLITYLYKETLECTLADNYRIVLSMLRESCGPYLMYIQDWVFHGSCRDLNNEFMIKVNNEFLYNRDKLYWTRGYTFRSNTKEEIVPIFMQGLADEIFNCGKSINLLKLCCPEHFICNFETEVPRLCITFSIRELEDIYQRTKDYARDMVIRARQKTITRQDKVKQDEEAREELAIRAHRQAAEELQRLKDNIMKNREAADKKKRKAFKELKDEMQKDVIRRATETEAEKQADKKLMEALTKQEQGEADVEGELESQARKELIDHYARLSEDAMRRERKALWHIRRRRLDPNRVEFLTRDEDNLRSLAVAKDLSSKDAAIQMKGPDAEETSSAEKVSTSEGHNQNNEMQERISGVLSSADIAQRVGQEEILAVPQIPDETQDKTNVLKKRLSDINQTVNEDVESALALIRDGDTRSEYLPNEEVAKGVRITIEEFLPRDEAEGSDDDAERAKDASVEDVLLEIGSTLPEANVDSKEVVHNSDGSVLNDRLKMAEGKTTETKTKLTIDRGRQLLRSLGSKSEDALDVTDYQHNLNAPKNALLQHASDSSVQSLMYPTQSDVKEVKSESEVKGRQDILPPSTYEPPTVGQHASDSSVQSLMYPTQSDVKEVKSESEVKGRQDILPPSTYEPPTVGQHASDSSVQSLMYPTQSDVKEVKSEIEVKGRQDILPPSTYEPATVGQHASDSSVQSLIYPSESDKAFKRPAMIEHVHVEEVKSEVRGQHDLLLSSIKELTLQHTSDSTIQDMMYPPEDGKKLRRTTLEKNLDEKIKLEKLHQFAKRSKAHSSDSSIQKLMYRDIPKSEDAVAESVQELELDKEVLRYWQEERDEQSFDYSIFDTAPNMDILAATGYIPSRAEIGDYGTRRSDDETIDAIDHLSLPVLLERSATAPLLAQIKLVNECILDYFHVELKIDDHFKALRRYLFLEDGEFGQSLCDQIFEKLSSNVYIHELFSPMFLNHVLSRAIQYSCSGNSDATNRLAFALKYRPRVFKPNAIDVLDCLELKYEVEWPSNIILTDTSLTNYNRIFGFLLKLKRSAWILRDVYHTLKRNARKFNESKSPQFHQLQLFRHEMQHFVSIMQGYVVNQVILVSWEEFQQDLKNNVHNLDDLKSRHSHYLNNALLRCLLNKKAAPIMKVITNILNLVLTVRSQLLSEKWEKDPKTGAFIHPGYRNIKKSYEAFKDNSNFLYKVVSKLVTRGYQTHLEEFLMLLNFNNL